MAGTRAVWKVSVHFEYLENWSSGRDVTWQPVRGDLTVHLRTVTLPWVQSVSSETPLTELEYCVTTFTMTEWADQLHHDNVPAHSTALMQAFLAKHRITQICQHPYSPDLAPCHFWFFSKLKSPLKVRRFVNAMVTPYTSSVSVIITADWLAPRESDCSQLHSKFSSDWLPSYIKATQPVLKIFKMDGYFLDSPHVFDKHMSLVDTCHVTGMLHLYR